MTDTRLNEARKQGHQASGSLNYLLEVFGDTLADREGYRSLSGIEAVQFYIMQKYNWLPRDVRSMSYEDMRFVLTQELEGWVAPPGTP